MKRENNHGEGGHVCPSFSSKKTQQGVYAAEEAKEKTQTESKQKACMGMEMEMPDSATFISGDICFFCGGTSWIWHLLSVSE